MSTVLEDAATGDEALRIDTTSDGALPEEATATDHTPHAAAPSPLRHALLVAAAMVIGLSALIFYFNIVSVATEGEIRREIAAIYELQLHAQKITTLGHQLRTARSDNRRDEARSEIAQQVNRVREHAGRVRRQLNPLIDVVAVGLDRTAKNRAYRDLDQRLDLLSRSAEKLVEARAALDIRFALNSIDAQTRSDLMSDLNTISSWYALLARRMQTMMQALQIAAIPFMVLAFWFVWLAAIKPALARERTARARLVESEMRARHMAQRAESASRAKSQFLATMSHEIRTPMNGMIALIDLLEKRPDPEEQTRLIDVIQKSGRLLEHIVNDILDLSKIEAGELAIELVPFDPVAVVDQVAASQGQAARDRGIRLHTTVDRETIGYRLGDPLRLRQVLNNLVNNAVKFTEDGHVEVVLQRDGDDPAGNGLRIVVTDTGIGMSETQIARAFETFRQADSSTTRRFGGSGLGLAIVRRLVVLMGGEVTIDSMPGRGTSIAVRLSFGPAPSAGVAQQHDPVTVAPLEGLKVLAADDNRTNRIVLERLLAHLGCVATIVGSGREAVEAAARERFAIILLDISMPEMDGIEALSAIRSHERMTGRRAVPTLAVTANAFAHHVEEYLAAGFAAHVAKPLRAETLRRAVADVIATAAPPSTASGPLPPAERLSRTPEMTPLPALRIVRNG